MVYSNYCFSNINLVGYDRTSDTSMLMDCSPNTAMESNRPVMPEYAVSIGISFQEQLFQNFTFKLVSTM